MNSVGKKVVILGGGVAGLSAAHELIERGFEVEVYERNPTAGGKARSVAVEGSGSGGRKDLPGEHGFRFFPGFYKHVTDTMRRTPADGNSENDRPRIEESVYKNLYEVPRVYFDSLGADPIELPTRFPKNLNDLRALLDEFTRSYREQHDIKIDYVNTFAERIWQVLTSCERRRTREYERMAWWDFTNADEHNAEQYRRYLVQTMTRSLVAANARDANAKVVGDIAIQVLSGLFQPGRGADWALKAPTNEAWIDPWHKYLAGRGVKFKFMTAVVELNYPGKEIESVTLAPVDKHGQRCGPEYQVRGDYYLAALPVEAMACLLEGPQRKHLRRADPQFEDIVRLKDNTEWMTGIQFYFQEEFLKPGEGRTVLKDGHVVFLDSPWALTAISQPSIWHWQADELRQHGAGNVADIVSVIISDWDKKGILYGKTARLCTQSEIEDEVLLQMERSLRDEQGTRSLDALRKLFAHPPFLDPELRQVPQLDGTLQWDNRSPLFINKPGTWHSQPEAVTRIPNLFLAADYVRTFTQLPTMEAANEAARHAVNGIIKALTQEEAKRARLATAAGHPQQPRWVLGRTSAESTGDGPVTKIPFCKVWDLHEPGMFWFWRCYDKFRFRCGLPWRAEVPPYIQPFQSLVIRFYEAYVRAATFVGGRRRSASLDRNKPERLPRPASPPVSPSKTSNLGHAQGSQQTPDSHTDEQAANWSPSTNGSGAVQSMARQD